MAKTRTILQVFVASPSDVADERTMLADVISEFNNTWGDRNAVTLELLRWETHSHPALGADSQDVINNHIGDEYDIFIGIMWGRFGTRTKRAESGTEEEFNRALARRLPSNAEVQILFYFKDAALQPSKIDALQLQKVQEFKKRIADEHGGLYHAFQTSEQFQTSVRMHLSATVQEWLDANRSKALCTAKDDNTAIAISTRAKPLANLSALSSDSDELGVIELVEIASEAMAEVNNIVSRMSEATDLLGSKFTLLATEANNRIQGGPDMTVAKRLSNNAANDLEFFVNRMSIEIVEFNKQSSLAMETFGNVAMIAAEDLNENPNDIAVTRTNMQNYTKTISNTAEILGEFRETISKMPRMTTPFNRAKKRAVAVMDDLLIELRIAASQSLDVDTLLARIENHPGKSQ